MSPDKEPWKDLFPPASVNLFQPSLRCNHDNSFLSIIYGIPLLKNEWKYEKKILRGYFDHIASFFVILCGRAGYGKDIEIVCCITGG